MQSSLKKTIRAEEIQVKNWQLERSEELNKKIKQEKKVKNTPPQFI